MITVTPTAIGKIKDLLKTEPAESFLRIAVESGGCSGLSYHFIIDTALTPDDHKIHADDAFVVIDAVSLSFLTGGTLDYVDELSRASFVMINPNAVSGCGCGNSFSI